MTQGIQLLLGFIGTTWLLAMLPGVGQALMLRQTLTDGPRAAVATILGTSTGLVVWASAAAAGLSAVVLTNPTAYRLILFAGGTLLIVIGLRTTWKACRQPAAAGPADGEAPTRGRRSAYLSGLATNLGNPKAGVFALSLLPAFAGGTFVSILGLGLVWSAVTASWYLVFVWLVSRGSALFSQARVQRLISCASGIVLVVVGTAVAYGW